MPLFTSYTLHLSQRDDDCSIRTYSYGEAITLSRELRLPVIRTWYLSEMISEEVYPV